MHNRKMQHPAFELEFLCLRSMQTLYGNINSSLKLTPKSEVTIKIDKLRVTDCGALKLTPGPGVAVNYWHTISYNKL